MRSRIDHESKWNCEGDIPKPHGIHKDNFLAACLYIRTSSIHVVNVAYVGRENAPANQSVSAMGGIPNRCNLVGLLRCSIRVWATLRTCIRKFKILSEHKITTSRHESSIYSIKIDKYILIDNASDVVKVYKQQKQGLSTEMRHATRSCLDQANVFI